MTMKITGPLFLHDTLVYADVTPYQVWLQKVQHLEKQLKFLTFAVQNSNLTFSLDTLAYIMICHNTKFGYKRIISSEDLMLLVDIFWLYKPQLWPWPSQ